MLFALLYTNEAHWEFELQLMPHINGFDSALIDDAIALLSAYDRSVSYHILYKTPPEFVFGVTLTLTVVLFATVASLQMQ